MHVNKRLFILSIFIVIAGFGCDATDSPVSLDKYQMPETTTEQPQPTAVDEQALTQTQPAETPQQAQPQDPVTSTPPAEPEPAAEKSQKPTNPPKEEPMPEPTQPETLAFPGALSEANLANKQIRIKTEKGDIVFEILGKEGPKAASNFIYLTERGFYNDLIFHRVEPGFVIQGGDPQGDGTGGPGYKFEDDTVSLPYNEGIVAMANAGPNTNGSQFFIMLADNPLPPKYSIFGRVISGMDVVKQIKVGDVMTSVIVESLK